MAQPLINRRLRGAAARSRIAAILSREQFDSRRALSFATRPGCEGLELIGKSQTGAKSLGLHLHATLAVTDTGLPLGVLRMGFDAVTGEPAQRRKTKRWLDGFRDIAGAVREVGGKTRVGSRRSASAAAARLCARSACATTASRSSNVPGSRAARQSGSRLKVVWLSGQYQRAMRVPRGLLRA